jgi:hypothetical protein
MVQIVTNLIYSKVKLLFISNHPNIFLKDRLKFYKLCLIQWNKWYLNQGSFVLFGQDMKEVFKKKIGYSKRIKLTCF